MRIPLRWLAAAALVLCLAAPAARPATAGEKGPMDTVREGIDKALAVLRDPALKAPERKEERRRKLEAAVDEYFNWPAMARSSLGIHWRKLTDQQRREYVRLYRQLVRNTYMTKVEGYTSEKILYDKERVQGNYARVYMRIITTKGQEVPVVNSMKRFDGQWLVYDIAVEGVRLVNNYRTQFSSMLNRMSYSEFLDELRKKVAKLAEEM